MERRSNCHYRKQMKLKGGLDMKHRMMVVDDEVLERQALKSMITKLFDDVEVVAEAGNGRSAIELADEKHPDIITMDIKLPGMDGLQTIEEIQLNHPHIRFIVLSAFDTFSYAQKAMTLNVNHYLLKPYKQEELKETVSKICRDREREQKARVEKIKMKDHQEHMKTLVEVEWVSTIIHNQIQDISIDELNQLIGLSFNEGIGVIVYFHEKNGHIEDSQQKSYLYQQVKTVLKQTSNCLVGPMIYDHIPLFMLKQSGEAKVSLRNQVITNMKKLFDHLSTIPHLKDVSVSAGAGTSVYNLEGFQESYHEALVASRSETKDRRVQFYQDLAKEKPVKVDSINREKELLVTIQQVDYERAHRMMEGIINDQVLKHGVHLEKIKRSLTELFILISRLSDFPLGQELAYFPEVVSVDQLRNTAFYRLNNVMQVLEKQKEQKSEDMLENIQSYIKQHFKDDLSLESISNQVNLSPSYFSKLFKEKTGQTLIDYLSKVRIKKAKEYLNTSDLSLKEICFEVGYHDPNYFSRVFKKYERVSPRQYRQEVAKKQQS